VSAERAWRRAYRHASPSRCCPRCDRYAARPQRQQHLRLRGEPEPDRGRFLVHARGVIADFAGQKKRFLLFFTALACVATATLFFVRQGDALAGMVIFIIAEIGYRGGQVFYNALLPEVADREETGRISGNGWAIGLVGGIVCLLLVLVLVTVVEGATSVRLSLVITALYFALFAAPPLHLAPRERPASADGPQ